MKAAKYILKCLEKEGVDVVFGYPGGAVIPLFDAAYDFEGIRIVRTCHEQGASHAADGYARSTGKVGVCIATSGPGATNIITGLATAYMDSIPMVAITGQVGRSLLGKDSFQEIDITGLTMGITKHNYLVKDAAALSEVFREAFFLAKDKRPGPVLIDISKDVFLEEMEEETPYEPKSVQKEEMQESLREDVREVAEMIRQAKSPVIYAGGGIIKSDSSEELTVLAQTHRIPVLNSIMGLGSFDRKSELSYGIVGMHGDREANILCYESDLILGIGVRFSDRAIGNRQGFTKGKIVHIDVDETEMGKNVDVDKKLIGDFKQIFSLLHKELDNYRANEILRETKKYPLFHPQRIFETLQKNLPKDTIVVTDVGQHQMWTAKYWDFDRPRQLITSGGLGTMGFGMGAALGSKMGNPERSVLLVTGDGSFRMNHNELLTLSHYKVPVTVVILNNNALGMVRQWQSLFCDERYSHTTVRDGLDISMLANAYHVDYALAKNLEELEEAISSQKEDRTLVVEYMLSEDTFVYPIVPPGQSIDRLIEQ